MLGTVILGMRRVEVQNAVFEPKCNRCAKYNQLFLHYKQDGPTYFLGIEKKYIKKKSCGMVHSEFLPPSQAVNKEYL